VEGAHVEVQEEVQEKPRYTMQRDRLQWAASRFDMLLLLHGADGGASSAGEGVGAWVLIKKQDAERDFLSGWLADAARFEWRDSSARAPSGTRLCATGRVSCCGAHFDLITPALGGAGLRAIEAVFDHVVARDPAPAPWRQVAEGEEDAGPSDAALAAAKLLVGWTAHGRANEAALDHVLAQDAAERSALVFACDERWRGLF
jgi:hypothetical protein